MKTKCHPPFYGKYRGVVTNNKDDARLGRIRAKVPDVFGDLESGWALPCFAYAGPQVGLYLIPPERALVWIEFEQGDPEYPIWTGCFLREGPADWPLPLSIVPDKKILKTKAWTITLDDSPGNAQLSIESSTGPVSRTRVSIEGTKLKITNDTAVIQLEGPKVSINGNALEVT